MARRVDTTKLLGWIRPWALVVAFFVACGPPLTQPSSLDLTGHWTSADHIGPVFNLDVVIRQNPDGTITGTWASDVSPPNPVCPPQLSARSVGTVSGSSTVLGVQFSLLGVGDFQGQAIDSTTLKGSFESCGSTYTVTLLLVGPPPAG
jgi:hypothetical protein